LKVHGVQRLDDVVVQVLVAAIPIERGDQRAQLCGEARVVGLEPRAQHALGLVLSRGVGVLVKLQFSVCPSHHPDDSAAVLSIPGPNGP